MIDSARTYRVVGVALLLVGSAMPGTVTAHSEGVEAADPNTPPAVLTFDGAARRYTAPRSTPANWRTRFAADTSSMAEHAGHAGHAEHDGAMQHAPSQHHQQ